MPSLPDGIVIFVLALLLFGPKKLPGLARELGKWIGEFRRASNEFKMQMEDELRVADQADRQKEIAAMEAAAPVPALPGVPVDDPGHPHLPSSGVALPTGPTEAEDPLAAAFNATEPMPAADAVTAPAPLPIAVSGELSIMPPATGLPAARSTSAAANGLGTLLDAIPTAEPAANETLAHEAAPTAAAAESPAHHG